MRTEQDERQAEWESMRSVFIQSELRARGIDATPAALARLATGKAPTRDSQPVQAEPLTNGARAMNEILSRHAFHVRNNHLVRDAGMPVRQLYTETEWNELYPRFSDPSQELPDYVPQSVSRAASQRSNSPWPAREFDAPAAEDVTRNKALNEANRKFYEGPGQGHEPGEVTGYGPEYGKTGETDHDYGRYSIDPRSGRDPTPRRFSPPPPDFDDNGSYLSPRAATRMFRSPGEGDANADPRVLTSPPPGRDPNRRLVSQGVNNFGAASPNVGNPDRWTEQAGLSPGRLRPPSKGAGGGAMANQIGLRTLNNRHRMRYGDPVLDGALPGIQREDADSEVEDPWLHARIDGKPV